MRARVKLYFNVASFVVTKTNKQTKKTLAKQLKTQSVGNNKRNYKRN